MSADLAIDRFQPKDEPSVIELWDDCFPGPRQPWNDPAAAIQRKTQAGDELFFVGKLKQRLVATVIVGYDGVRGWIYSLAVASDHRHQGIGRRLMAHVEQVLRMRGCPKVNLQVRGSNTGVIHFYEKLGYDVEDRASLGKPLGAAPITEVVDSVPTLPISDDMKLTGLRASDKASYLKHLNQTEQFNQFIWQIPYPYTAEHADQWLSVALRQTFEQDRSRQWAIRDVSDELIGGIGLLNVVPEEKAEVGYWLAKSFWGRGIMPQVLRRVCEYAFSEYRLAKVMARVISGNEQSKRVLAKVGFQGEGVLRSHLFRNGQAFDEHYYGLLKTDEAVWSTPFFVADFVDDE